MLDFICHNCGKPFKAYKQNANRFCSRPCYWDSKRDNLSGECYVCGKTFKVIKSRKSIFCSRVCLNKFKSKNSIDLPCCTCGKIIHRWKSSIHPKGNIYCSRKCSAKAAERPGCKTSPGRKLHTNISRMVSKTITGTKNYRKWQDLVGYSVSDLKEHLEKQFSKGMSWENYGLRGWHIDHKIPRFVFNFSNPNDDDFKKCWSLKNLQPMWSTDNIRKGRRLERPFQPSLSFPNNEAKK